MWMICKKELISFFSNLTGYIIVTIFLIANALVLFVFEGNILDDGYATLERFFAFAPWMLLLLIPAVTMRSLADEYKTGTIEILKTLPLTTRQIVGGKFLACFTVAVIALVPTLLYAFTIEHFSITNGLDIGATIGAYLGLFFLAAVFTAVGIFSSSLTNNAVVALIITISLTVTLYYAFTAISNLLKFTPGIDYFIALLGIDYHYNSISRGVIDVRDVIYFLSMLIVFIVFAIKNLKDRN